MIKEINQNLYETTLILDRSLSRLRTRGAAVDVIETAAGELLESSLQFLPPPPWYVRTWRAARACWCCHPRRWDSDDEEEPPARRWEEV